MVCINFVNEMAYGGNTQGMDNFTKAIGDLGNTMLTIQKQKETPQDVKCNE